MRMTRMVPSSLLLIRLGLLSKERLLYSLLYTRIGGMPVHPRCLQLLVTGLQLKRPADRLNAGPSVGSALNVP